MDSTMARSGKARFPKARFGGTLALMNAPIGSIANVFDFGHPCPLRLMMVYEDFDMAVQAKKVCDLLAHEAWVGDEVQLSVWRFDAIASRDPGNAAGPQAEQADVIVVAARDLDRLPAQVEDWLERWPAHRHAGQGALVEVFHPDAARDGATSSVALRLWQAAARAGMDFFSSTSDWTVRLSRAPGTPTTPRLDLVPPTDEALSRRYCSLGWGIDE
jgi:hypothetical protein